MLEDIKEFNQKFGIEVLPAPGFLSGDDMKKRLDFQLEELIETAQAAGFVWEVDDRTGVLGFTRASTGHSKNSSKVVYKLWERSLPEILDGLVDQVYVALGTAAKMGFLKNRGIGESGDLYCVFEEAWLRVHKANMQKVIVPGQWKVQKPAGWVRPNLEDLCQ